MLKFIWIIITLFVVFLVIAFINDDDTDYSSLETARAFLRLLIILALLFDFNPWHNIIITGISVIITVMALIMNNIVLEKKKNKEKQIQQEDDEPG